MCPPEQAAVGQEGPRTSGLDPCSVFPSSLCPGAEEAGFPLTAGTHFSFPARPACYPASPAATSTGHGVGSRSHRNATSLAHPHTSLPLGQFRGVWFPAPRPHPYWLLIGWGGPALCSLWSFPSAIPSGLVPLLGMYHGTPQEGGRKGNFTFPCLDSL